MTITDYEQSLLTMIRKFGPAISSAKVEEREEALQKLVIADFATITRNNEGHIRYALTQKGREFLELEDAKEPPRKK